MAEKKIYLKGFRSFAKRDSAPDFVVGDLVINLKQFKEFVNSPEVSKYLDEYKGEPQLKVNMTWGDDANILFAVNTYGKDSSGSGEKKTPPQPPTKKEQSEQEFDPNAKDDLPF